MFDLLASLSLVELPFAFATGLVAKIPLSNESQAAFHVLQIEAVVPLSKSSSNSMTAPVMQQVAAARADAGGSTSSVHAGLFAPHVGASKKDGGVQQHTFSTRLDDSIAYINVRTELLGDCEKVDVQALRVLDTTRAIAGASSTTNATSSTPTPTPTSAPGTTSDNTNEHRQRDNDQSETPQLSQSTSVAAESSRLTALDSSNELTFGDELSKSAASANAAGGSAAAASSSDSGAIGDSGSTSYRIVYKLRMRDATTLAVDTSAFDIETSAGGKRARISIDMKTAANNDASL